MSQYLSYSIFYKNIMGFLKVAQMLKNDAFFQR
jgi:hypothetical protein